MPRKNAFTLVELLVVVSIIALLVSILLPSLSMAKNLASEKVCAGNLRNLHMGIILYAGVYMDRYPLEPTEHNPHPDLIRLISKGGYAVADLFYCPQAPFLETAARDTSYTPVGATDTVVNTPENVEAGNITYVYFSFTDNKTFNGTSWREQADFRPRQLTLDRPITIDPARPPVDAPPQERWVMSDFFRKGAPFPHARSHAKGLDVVFQDGHANLIFGSPKTIYR